VITRLFPLGSKFNITSITKKATFQDLALCGSCWKGGFGGTCSLRLQGGKNQGARDVSSNITNACKAWTISKNGVFWDVTPCGSLRTDVSEELSSSFIMVTRIGELGVTLAVISNQSTQPTAETSNLAYENFNYSKPTPPCWNAMCIVNYNNMEYLDLGKAQGRYPFHQKYLHSTS
jgi:hypothetical protein